MKLVFKVILLLIWMSVIFYFSHQSGEQSSETSLLVLKLFNFFHVDIDSSLGAFLHLMIRKLAHFSEYFILSLLFYNIIRPYTKYKYLYSIIFSCFYAIIDEIHQYYIPNRVASFLDVLIDTCGASLAMFFLYLINKLKPKVTSPYQGEDCIQSQKVPS